MAAFLTYKHVELYALGAHSPPLLKQTDTHAPAVLSLVFLCFTMKGFQNHVIVDMLLVLFSSDNVVSRKPIDKRMS